MKIKDLILEIRKLIRTRNVGVREESDQKAIIKIPVTRYSVGYMEIVVYPEECTVIKHFNSELKFKDNVSIRGNHSYEEVLELVKWFFENRFLIMKENSLRSISEESLEKDLKWYRGCAENDRRVAEQHRKERDESMAEVFDSLAKFCEIRAEEAKITLDYVLHNQ